MKFVFLTSLLFASFAGYNQKRFYPKTFNANRNAIYITNSTSQGDLAFMYVTPEDTSKVIFLIEKFEPSDLELLGDKLQLYNVKLCPADYKTKVRDFIFSITSENVLVYFFHMSDKFPDLKTNL